MSKLLEQRFEVINGYPNSPYKVGCILTVITDPFDSEVIQSANKMLQNLESNQLLTADRDISKYPHLFRPMEWWEKRTENEMPKYIRLNSTIHKVDEWKFNYKNVRIGYVYEKELTLVMSQHDFKPATEAEYNEYLKSK